MNISIDIETVTAYQWEKTLKFSDIVIERLHNYCRFIKWRLKKAEFNIHIVFVKGC